MKLLLIIFVFEFVSIHGYAQIYSSDNISVHFFAPAPITYIDALTNNAHGFIDTKKKEVKISMDMISFNFKKALMQQHFNEHYMETEKYPTASFKGNFKEELNLDRDGSYTINLEGKFNIHGVEKNKILPCTIIVKDGKAMINANFNLISKDYKIKLPQILYKPIAEEVNVSVNGLLNKVVAFKKLAKN